MDIFEARLVVFLDDNVHLLQKLFLEILALSWHNALMDKHSELLQHQLNLQWVVVLLVILVQKAILNVTDC